MMRRATLQTPIWLFFDLLVLGMSLAHIPALTSRPRYPFEVDVREDRVYVKRILDVAAAGGIREDDWVLMIGGQKVETDHDFELEADFHSIGDHQRVRVSRDESSADIDIAYIPFYRFGLIAISVIVGNICWIIGVFVFLMRPRDPAAVVLHFSLVCMGASIMLTFGQFYGRGGEAFLSRFSLFPIYMGVGAFFLHFTELFPVRRAGSERTLLGLIYVPAILMAVALIVSHYNALTARSLPLYREFWGIFHFFHIVLLVYVALGIRNFVQAFRTVKAGPERKKIAWIMFGIVLGALPFIILILIPELFIPVSPIPEEYTTIAFVFIPVSFAIAIVRYGALDIELVINRTTVYAVVITFLGGFYVLLVSAFATLFDAITVPFAAGAATLIAFLFEPVRSRVQNIVDRRFFRVRYDYRTTERGLLERLRTTMTLPEMAGMIVKEINEIIPVSGIAVLARFERSTLLAVESVGFSDESIGQVIASLRGMRVGTGILLAPDKAIAEGIKHYAVGGAAFSEAGAALIVPAGDEERVLVGALVLSEKLSGESFLPEDIDLLSNVMAQAASTILTIELQRELIRREAEADRLRQLNELKSDFVSYVSHEFRTPLTSIKMFAELLGAKTKSGDKEAARYLNILNGETDRLNRMVGNVLDAARIDRGVKLYRMVAVDLADVVEAVIRMMTYQIENDHFRLVVKGLRSGLSYPIYGDRDALIEALTNLFVNAMKYSGVKKWIGITVERDGQCVRISVADRGLGIHADALPHLFEKFYRAPTTSGSTEGFGLGLPLVKHILDAHKGSIEVESVPGQGSTFRIILPLRTTT